ncbi:ATP-binding protein [Cohnella faecalis]|uniref:hypothetical protein n=1 Tax=Cohnella faecalis TaxID=2315694 RepID=UPI001F45B12D|nr:hypothetical protein [Cohnella faecalis]
MLFVWIALWAIAFFLLASDPKAQTVRRLSRVAFCGGAGAFAAVLDFQFIPYLQTNYEEGVGLIRALDSVKACGSLLSYYGVPYAFLLFALSFRPAALSRNWRKALPVILLLPIVGCLLFTPAYNETYPVTFKVVVWWAVPYIVYGTVHILVRRPRNLAFSPTYWVVCIAVLTPVLLSMVMNYVLPSFGHLRMWVYNTWFVGVGVAVFVIGLFTYGFMGVRVLIDRRRLDSTFRAVTSGTAILNHAIKNDAGKMRLFAEKMKAYAAQTNQAELLADAETVLSASLHMQEMLAKVHRRTEDLRLEVRELDPAELIRSTLASFEPRLEDIKLNLTLAEGWRCRLDSAQAGEALANVAANAIEAMKGRGSCRSRLSPEKES